MQGKILTLSSYPIKGFSEVRHEEVSLKSGDGFPGDRMFGFAKKNSGFDINNPQPLPKDRFLVLFEHAKLAGLETSFDPSTQSFEIKSSSSTKQFDMADENGQAGAAGFLTELLNLPDDEVPFFAHAHPHRFTDVSVHSEVLMHSISLINLETIRAFESEISEKVDPRRFRGNVVLEGWPAFSELELVDQTIHVGNVDCKVLKRTRRCAATEVNPVTAERDIKVPYLLRKAYDHMDMGIYAEVVGNGVISVGDPVVAG